MSSSNDTEQFFPPYLKWISLSFFAGVFLLLGISMHISPQRIDSSRIDSTSANTNSVIPTPNIQSEQEAIGITAQETSIEPEVEAGPQPSTTPDTNPTPRTTSSNTDIKPTPNPASQEPSNVKSAVNGCKTGDIKGIIFNGKKYYYEIGRQKYYVIEKQTGIRLVECFKAVETAIKHGYSKAPDFPSLIRTIQKIGL